MLDTLEQPAPRGTAEHTAADQASARYHADGDRTAASYIAPQLVIYGSLRAITAAVGSKGMKDGSGSRKTGF